MLGRVDTIRKVCPSCQGTGHDAAKRTRQCPVCGGTGEAWFCVSCENYMPCPGTADDVFDQSHCDIALAEKLRGRKT